jgi:DNA-binding GntR family transcriptional regulator
MAKRETTLPTIQDQPIQEQVLQRIRDGIMQGALLPGAPLRIDRLAAELGVSHMPVREALHVLTVEGLAVRLPRRGVRVSSLTCDDLVGAYEVMATVEGLAARIAATRLTDGTLAELERILAPAPELYASGEPAGLMRINREFHSRMYDCCHNRWIHEFCRLLWNYVYRLRRHYPQSPQRLQEAIREHRDILAAMQARDADLAETLVRRHSARSRDDLLAQLAAAGVPGFEAAASGEAGQSQPVRQTRQTRRPRQTARPRAPDP